MKIVPLFDRVIITPDENETRTPGGIIIPDSIKDKERPQFGTVVAAGPGRYENGQLIKTTVKSGDRVVFAKYAGSDIKVDGAVVVMVKETDILGILK